MLERTAPARGGRLTAHDLVAVEGAVEAVDDREVALGCRSRSRALAVACSSSHNARAMRVIAVTSRCGSL